MQTLRSFEQVARDYTPLIKSQLKKLHLTKQFDDYFQIGLIALWHAYKNYDEKKGPFPTYAYRTVRGYLLTELRKEKRFRERHLLQEQQTSLLFDNETSRLDDEFSYELFTLEDYLEPLSERERRWVIEAIVLGKKTKEIAATYGVSTNTVQTWRKNAMKKLRAETMKQKT